MKKENIKKTNGEKEELRLCAVKMIVKGGMKKIDVKKILDVHYSSLVEWHNTYKKWWWKALKTSKNSWWRPKKENNNLTKKEQEILEKVVLKEPREAKTVAKKLKNLPLDFGLRTLKVIQAVVKELFGKEIKDWKIREVMIEMWFTNQTPLFRAYQQDPKKVELWIDQVLPYIQMEAEDEWRTIYYWDEAWFKSTDHRWKTRWKKGKTPIVKSTWARFWVNAISIISPKWELRFMAYESGFSSETLLLFLKRISYKNDKKITLILDGHPTHKSVLVKKYLASQNNKIKIYYLPWYSPELNPDEQVRNHMHNDLKGQIIASQKQMIDKIKKWLYRLQKKKDEVSSYFRHPEVKRK